MAGHVSHAKLKLMLAAGAVIFSKKPGAGGFVVDADKNVAYVREFCEIRQYVTSFESGQPVRLVHVANKIYQIVPEEKA